MVEEENMSKAHPGFGSVASKIASQQGISKESAGAILAHSTRNASPAAKKANPHLKQVSGKRDPTGMQEHEEHLGTTKNYHGPSQQDKFQQEKGEKPSDIPQGDGDGDYNC
jgi:hypothetical protein